MKIVVENRRSIQNISPSENHIIISITSPKMEWAKVACNANCKGLLQLQFSNEYETECVFSDVEASQIFGFILKYWSDVDLIICQCDAGISRSAAVAAAIGKIFNNDDSFIFENVFYSPNEMVYNQLLTTWENKFKP